MPIFKTTKNILFVKHEDELFDENWMDSNKLILPPQKPWDYSRELKIEDVDIWEVIYEGGGGIGVYASWYPYAEFYMITLPLLNIIPNRIETYYGPLAEQQVINRAKSLGIHLYTNKVWIDKEDSWLYQKQESKNIILYK